MAQESCSQLVALVMNFEAKRHFDQMVGEAIGVKCQGHSLPSALNATEESEQLLLTSTEQAR